MFEVTIAIIAIVALSMLTIELTNVTTREWDENYKGFFQDNMKLDIAPITFLIDVFEHFQI